MNELTMVGVATGPARNCIADRALRALIFRVHEELSRILVVHLMVGNPSAQPTIKYFL